MGYTADMSKEVSVILLGLFTALVPYLGLPGSWRTILLVITGLCIATLGFFLRREVLSRGGTHRADFFVDNRPQQTTAQPTSHETSNSRPKVS